MRHVLAIVAMAGLAVGMAGCGSADPDAPRLTVENRTDIAIGVYVNGDWIGTDEPGARIETALRPSTGSAYRIEARSPSGAVLATFEVPRDAIGSAPLGQAFSVPCGEIYVLVGELGPGETLAPADAVAAGACP